MKKDVVKEISESGGMTTKRELMGNSGYYAINKAIERGEVKRLKNGVYALDSALADTMIDVERIVPRGVLCLYSAWAYYGLSTQIPDAYYIAVEKHRKVVVPTFPPITLCYWQKEYCELGVTETEISGYKVRISDLEKSVCDAVKFRNKIGKDVCAEVLKTYLARKDRNIAVLTSYAKKMRIATTLTQYLEIGL